MIAEIELEYREHGYYRAIGCLNLKKKRIYLQLKSPVKSKKKFETFSEELKPLCTEKEQLKK